MREILDLAVKIQKARLDGGGQYSYLKNKVLGMIFRRACATRVLLRRRDAPAGGNWLYYRPMRSSSDGRKHGDVARVISRYVNVVMARVFAHHGDVELTQCQCARHQWARPVLSPVSGYGVLAISGTQGETRGVANWLTLATVTTWPRHCFSVQHSWGWISL